MNRRYVLLGLASILALALAVPAMGGPSNPIATGAASAKKTAKKALKKAKKAQKTAKAAGVAAGDAQQDANNAQQTANGAQTAAEAAQASADAAQSSANTAQTTADGAASAGAAAQATADNAFDDTNWEEGEASPVNSAANKLVSAVCPTGEEPLSGGWVLTGAGDNDVTVVLNTQYLQGWLINSEEIGGGTADTWGITASVVCGVRAGA